MSDVVESEGYPSEESSQGTHARHWGPLTIFEGAEWDWFRQASNLARLKHYSFQEEQCPVTGRRHLQAYLGFLKPVRFSTLKGWFPTAHLKMANRPLGAYNYCCKADTRVDGGFSGRSDPPSTAVASGAGESSVVAAKQPKRKWTGLVADAVADGADWRSIGVQFRHEACMFPGPFRTVFESVKFADLLAGDVSLPVPEVVILFGPPGTGKSSTARLMFGERRYFRMTIGKWCDGYAYETGLLIDDMEPRLMPRAQLLLLMESGWCRWEVKGGTVMLVAQQIIITSNWHPNEWFPPAKGTVMSADAVHERAQAVIRRAKVFECTASGVHEVKSTSRQTFTPLRSVCGLPPLYFSFFSLRRNSHSVLRYASTIFGNNTRYCTEYG